MTHLTRFNPNSGLLDQSTGDDLRKFNLLCSSGRIIKLNISFVESFNNTENTIPYITEIPVLRLYFKEPLKIVHKCTRVYFVAMS